MRFIFVAFLAAIIFCPPNPETPYGSPTKSYNNPTFIPPRRGASASVVDNRPNKKTIIYYGGTDMEGRETNDLYYFDSYDFSFGPIYMGGEVLPVASYHSMVMIDDVIITFVLDRFYLLDMTTFQVSCAKLDTTSKGSIMSVFPPRNAYAMCLNENERSLFLHGGRSASNNTDLGDLYELDISNLKNRLFTLRKHSTSSGKEPAISEHTCYHRLPSTFGTVFGNQDQNGDNYVPVFEYNLISKYWYSRDEFMKYSELMRSGHSMDTQMNIIYIYGGINPTTDTLWQDIILMDSKNSSTRAHISWYSGYPPEGGRFYASARAIDSDWLFVHGGFASTLNINQEITMFAFNKNVQSWAAFSSSKSLWVTTSPESNFPGSNQQLLPIPIKKTRNSNISVDISGSANTIQVVVPILITVVIVLALLSIYFFIAKKRQNMKIPSSQDKSSRFHFPPEYNGKEKVFIHRAKSILNMPYDALQKNINHRQNYPSQLVNNLDIDQQSRKDEFFQAEFTSNTDIEENHPRELPANSSSILSDIDDKPSVLSKKEKQSFTKNLYEPSPKTNFPKKAKKTPLSKELNLEPANAANVVQSMSLPKTKPLLCDDATNTAEFVSIPLN